MIATRQQASGSLPPAAFHIASTIIPRGDGSVIVQPGRPVEWLSTAQLGKEFGVSRKTICAWREAGDIPESIKVDGADLKVVRRQGKKKLSFHAALIPWLRAKFDSAGE